VALVDALEAQDEDARCDSVDVVGVVDELRDVFLGDLPVPRVAQHVLRLHDRLYGLLAHRVVVVFEEGSNDFFVEVAVFVEAERFEEVDE
jgi:hypothetical protein